MSIRGGIRLQMAAQELFGFTVAVATAVEDEGKSNSVNYLCVGKDKDNVHDVSTVDSVLTCPVCKNNDRETFKRGKFRQGVASIIDAAELAAARVVDPKEYSTITISTYDAEEIDRCTLPQSKPYFLELPNKGDADLYATFVEMVKATPEIAYIGVFSLKGASRIHRLSVFENALTITPIAWPAAIKQPPANLGTPNQGNLALAIDLVRATKQSFDPDNYVNDRAKRVAAVIDAGTPVAAMVDKQGKVAPVTSAAPAMDDALRQAVAAAKAAKAPAPRKAPAKRAPAKRAPKAKAKAGKP